MWSPSRNTIIERMADAMIVLDGENRIVDLNGTAELIASPEMEEHRIDSAVEAQLQPIVQEALINARRYGEAKRAKVTIAPCDGTLQITIEDDGRGFSPDELASQGFGLRSMRGRAEAIGGVFEVDSKPGEGTRVSVRVPWQKEGV